ncbi:MAG: hypothetical protein Q9159_001226 [Coniocarpon cinnabarinum]
MKYSLTAAALASLATGTLAAVAHPHHRHHAREAAPQQTQYTYSNGQCWGAGNGCDPTTVASAPAQTVAPTVATGQAEPAVKAAAVNQPSAAAPSSSATSGSSGDDGTSDDSTTSDSSAQSSFSLSDFTSHFTSNYGMKEVQPDSSVVCEGLDNGEENSMEICNDSDDDFVWTCWGADGSWVNAKSPVLAVPISKGDKKTISFAPTTQSKGPACAAVFSDTVMSNGQFNETWLEATYTGSGGTVDVSREVNMQGHSISATTASGCLTSMDSCVFKCPSPMGQPTSQWGPLYGHCFDQYKLNNQTSPGCHGDDMNGGCDIGSGKTTVSVTGLASSLGIDGQ